MDTTFHHLSGYHPRLNLPLILLWGVGSAALVVLMSCSCRRVGAETVESAASGQRSGAAGWSWRPRELFNLPVRIHFPLPLHKGTLGKDIHAIYASLRSSIWDVLQAGAGGAHRNRFHRDAIKTALPRALPALQTLSSPGRCVLNLAARQSQPSGGVTTL